MRRLQHGPSHDLLLLEILFEHFLAAPFRSHHGVTARHERIERQSALCERMSGTHQANEAVREQPLLKKIIAGQIGEVADRQIDLAGLQSAFELRGRQRNRAKVRLRRALRQCLQ